MIKKIFYLLIFMVPAICVGQDYKLGIGLRAGYNPGITVKYMLSEARAIEGIVHYRYNGTVITALYEMHTNAFGEDKLFWFYGLGGHVGYYARPDYFKRNKYYAFYYERRPSIGIDGIIGLEYRVEEIPFSIGVDLKPYVDIYYPGFGLLDGALSVRFRF
jgi:hypothetical protein